jgi:transposase
VLNEGVTNVKYHINSHTWEQILLFLRQERRIHTKDTVALRIFIEGIWYIVRSGCQWRLLPYYYGSWRAVHRRFKRWSDTGVWERLMQYVANPDEEAIIIDATIVRSHACSSGYGKDSQVKEALGRGRGGFSTKIHAVVDALGNPLRFILTAGQRNEITQAIQLTDTSANAIVIAGSVLLSV